MTQPKKTDKVFKSPSSGVMCSAAQYIAEVMCLRKAERDNEGSLAYKFWNKSQKKAYQAQIVAAQKLISEFNEDILLAFINSTEGQKIYSLGFYNPLPFVKEMLAKFSRTYKPIQTIIEEAKPKIDVEQKPRKVFVEKKKSIFSKLKEVENKDGKNKDS